MGDYPVAGFGAEPKEEWDMSRMQRTVAREVGRVLGSKIETMDVAGKVLVVRMSRDQMSPEIAASMARAMEQVKRETQAMAVLILDHDIRIEALHSDQMRAAGWVPAESPERTMAPVGD